MIIRLYYSNNTHVIYLILILGQFMNRKNVTSSNLLSVGYDTKSKILEIEFHSGGIYQYFEVPKSEFDALMAASSHGSYFYQNIRNQYRTEKIQ